MQYTLYIGTLLSMYQYHSAVLITPLLGLELPHYMRLVFLVLKYFIKQYRSIYQYIYISVPQCSTDHHLVGFELPDYMRLLFLILNYLIIQYRYIYQYIYVSVPQCSTDHRPVGLELPDCVTWIVSPRVLNWYGLWLIILTYAMAPISDGQSEHVAHSWRKKGLSDKTISDLWPLK